MDVHLAWRAEGCPCGSGEVFTGTAPWTQLRAVEDVLRENRGTVVRDLARLVVTYGEVLPLDALVVQNEEFVSVVKVEAPCHEGFRSAMLTVTLSGKVGEQFMQLVAIHAEHAEPQRQAGFVAVIGADCRGESLLSKIAQAKTVRLSELPNLLLPRGSNRAVAT